MNANESSNGVASDRLLVILSQEIEEKTQQLNDVMAQFERLENEIDALKEAQASVHKARHGLGQNGGGPDTHDSQGRDAEPASLTRIRRRRSKRSTGQQASQADVLKVRDAIASAQQATVMQGEIQEWTGLDQSTVSRAVRQLVDANDLEFVGRDGHKNLYRTRARAGR